MVHAVSIGLDMGRYGYLIAWKVAFAKPGLQTLDHSFRWNERTRGQICAVATHQPPEQVEK